MSDIALNPCPFCGGTAFMVQEGTHVQCLTPGCCVGPVCGLDSWNTRASQWQPIESAPKDGDILAWDGYDTRVTHWHTRPSGAGGWLEQIDQYEVIFWQPTHWQPLPASPEVVV